MLEKDPAGGTELSLASKNPWAGMYDSSGSYIEMGLINIFFKYN